MLVQRHGLDAFRLPAAAYYAAEGLGGLLRAWGAKPEIALDTRDVAVFGFHADGVSYTSSSRAGSSKSVCWWPLGMWCLLESPVIEGAGACSSA